MGQFYLTVRFPSTGPQSEPAVPEPCDGLAAFYEVEDGDAAEMLLWCLEVEYEREGRWPITFELQEASSLGAEQRRCFGETVERSRADVAAGRYWKDDFGKSEGNRWVLARLCKRAQIQQAGPPKYPWEEAEGTVDGERKGTPRHVRPQPIRFRLSEEERRALDTDAMSMTPTETGVLLQLLDMCRMETLGRAFQLFDRDDPSVWEWFMNRKEWPEEVDWPQTFGGDQYPQKGPPSIADCALENVATLAYAVGVDPTPLWDLHGAVQQELDSSVLILSELEREAVKTHNTIIGRLRVAEEQARMLTGDTSSLNISALLRLAAPHFEQESALAEELAGVGAESTQRAMPKARHARSDRLTDEACRHSEDFRSVIWYGQRYFLTAKQAACVRTLWKAWENNTPDVADRTVLTNAGADTKRLAHVFRDHPAWGHLIVKGKTQGTHRLWPAEED